ncbi:hypothetical protein Ac42p094 [Acinetobacter phage Ac42]|uniref:hypothetical protein n=1 Tax=Acinetobacter phage Ac42 TaxID=762660 RepID=UPI0001EBCCF8|nr:hypothetical protein Ac42p094 [Acinetobacter phage Ac42]ADI96332.1 hypothetical protein Ac42p094 [Acinetobacter phage Ac42]
MKTKLIFPHKKVTLIISDGQIHMVTRGLVNEPTLRIATMQVINKYLFEHPNDVKESFARDFAKVAKAL